MKTIPTVLPIYNRIEKQSFQRALGVSGDKPIVAPVITPLHKLPVFQFQPTTENGIIDLELMGPDDVVIAPASKTPTFTNISYSTYTAVGDTVTAVAPNATTRGQISGIFPYTAGQIYKVDVYLTYTSGEYPFLDFFNQFMAIQTEPLMAGMNTIFFQSSISNATMSFALRNTTTASFSLKVISIKQSLLEEFKRETNDITILTDISGDTAWCQAYDTAVRDLGNGRAVSAIKTTSTGTASMLMRGTKMSTNITLGDKYHCIIYLSYTSGSYPKMAIVDTTGCDEWDIYSNVVTLHAGMNVFTLEVNETVTSNGIYIALYNSAGEVANFNARINYAGLSYFPSLITGTTDWVTYYGETLNHLIEPGLYYLRMTSGDGYVYYSDWILVTCVFTNLLTSWTNISYNTFVSALTEITSGINTGGFTGATTDTFSIRKGEVIHLITNLTLNSGQVPKIKLYSDGLEISAEYALASGINDISITATGDSEEAYITLYNTGASNFSLTDVQLIRTFSDQYLTFIFSHSCDIGDYYYSGGLEQTMYLETEPLEPNFPYVEKGLENGFGTFIPTWQRQDKTYIIRTLYVPQFIVEVLHRLKIHDSVEIIDLVGDEFTVESINTEQDWQGEDKYYALATITVNLGEKIIVTACCSAVDEC